MMPKDIRSPARLDNTVMPTQAFLESATCMKEKIKMIKAPKRGSAGIIATLLTNTEPI